MMSPPIASALNSVDWQSWTVASDWQDCVEAFFTSSPGRTLLARLQQRLEAGAVIYPAQPLRMLALTPRDQVRVVILGQDPYHGPGQAEGLAFSVPNNVPVPPSLRNIRKELWRDLGAAPQWTGSLVSWAQQGVLLLNTALTVEDGCAASHAGWGWETLTRSVFMACQAGQTRRVFMLWGAHAHAFAATMDRQKHHCLQASHPSPLSALRGPQPFIGCGHFSEANRWHMEKKEVPIDWLG